MVPCIQKIAQPSPSTQVRQVDKRVGLTVVFQPRTGMKGEMIRLIRHRPAAGRANPKTLVLPTCYSNYSPALLS